ncbi:MAG: PspC domain-containing protein [Candidatus Heimdallarchaeota archaeon]
MMQEKAANETLLLPFEREKERTAQKKRIFYRSQDDYFFAGVCGGLANLWNMDSTLIRLLYIFLTIITGGLMAIVYLILMKAIPLEPLD